MTKVLEPLTNPEIQIVLSKWHGRKDHPSITVEDLYLYTNWSDGVDLAKEVYDGLYDLTFKDLEQCNDLLHDLNCAELKKSNRKEQK